MRGTALGAAACLAAACAGGGIAASSASGSVAAPSRGDRGHGQRPSGAPPRALPAAAWPQFDQNAARTGVAAGLPAARALTTAWTAQLDGAVYGQPLVVGARGDRGDGERHRLRDLPRDRQDGLARARRHPGAAVGPARVRRHLPARHHRDARLRPVQRPGLRRRGDDRVPPRAVRAVGDHRRGQGAARPRHRRRARTSPPTTSSARRSRSTTDGSTPRSAGWPATAARISDRSSGRP